MPQCLLWLEVINKMNICQMCFKLVYLFFFFGKQTLGQTCYTPDKQQGHCVPLNDCPKAFPTFANPSKASETHLQRFLCKDDQQLKVCCSTTANFTLLENYLIDYIDPVIHGHAFTDHCSGYPGEDIDLPLILAESLVCDVKPKKCLGILANPRYVITPAQCVGQQFRLVGVQFRGKNNNSITFGVEEVISHPFFDPVSGVNDIALLRLNQIVSSDDVKVLCREFLKNSKWIYIYTNLDLSTIDGGINKEFVYIESLSKENCEETFLQKGAHAVVTEYDLCTKNTENATKFTCEFTGVPLFSQTNRFGNGFIGFSSSRTVCDDGLPDIYTNVNAYEDWLIDQMKPWPTTKEPCTTPNREIGKCFSVFYCAALRDAFTDVTNAVEAAHLSGFICERDDTINGFTVCCVMSSNSTIVHKRDELKPADVPTKFLETRLCGLQHRDDYFSSSTAIAIDEFPWIAIITRYEEYEDHCTGTLINSRYVLTTGTCLDHYRDNKIVRLGDFYRFNETSCVKDPDVDATDCTETEIYGIEDVISHPFAFEFGFNDIALVRLNKTVSYYTDFVRPICLPIPGTPTAKVGDAMYMSTWGTWSREVDPEGDFKKKFLTHLIEKEECQRLLRKEIVPNTFCTLDNNTELYLGREKGGALMFHDNYRWHIEGIMFQNRYESGLPVVYVNVSRYINWILANMNPW